ncbi:MAG: ABC transporter substrate-binding protein [Hyphomicrobiales bacterium]|nr:ABC transporter substrate-binding protein [Hyphomicrobiales bacterium]MCP5373929.1 ABC transporter substrate-binding protein [Hyphomicrobiales bacterium]
MRKLFYGLAAAAALATLAAQAEAAKDTITLGMQLEPPHLDPTAGAAAAIDEVTYANIFEGLTRIDQNGGVKPALAESWTISDDGLVYTFKLHKGVKFHDGTDMDSADVKFSLERAMDEKSTNAQKGLFKPISKVEAPDASTVVVTLSQPTGRFLFNMGWGDAVVVAPESAEGNKTNPVGTGPFKFKNWTKGDRLTIERNPNYWGTAVKLKSATFKFISDPAAATAAVLAGDVDAFPGFPAPEALAQFKSDPRLKVVVGSTEGETILSTNNKSKYFSDVRVRRAMAHAIDRQAIIDGAMFGYGTPIGSHFAPHHPAYVDLTGMYPYDLAKAKALLAEAGYPNGFKARLHLPPPSYARRGGEIIAAQLAKIGIQLEIIPVEWAQWLKAVFKGYDYDLTIVSHTEPMDIGIYARDSYYFQYDSPEFKALMKKLDMATDEKTQYDILRQAQRKLAEDAVNGFLFQLAKTGVWNAKLRGLWPNSPTQANDLTGVYWVD